MAVVSMQRFDIYLVSLDPAQGSEIKKTRPCVIISPNEMNVLKTVLVAPLTTKEILSPTRIALRFQGKKGQIALDQIRAVDKLRLVKHVGKIENITGVKLLETLQEMFAF